MELLANEVYKELKMGITNDREIVVDIKKLPPSEGDFRLIRQVFVNLFSNAIKYTRARKTSMIEVGAYGKGKENIYYIKDNGVGFEMAYVDKLFGVFQRLHSPSEFEGTGVGLAIVKRIINRHAGRVWAEAKVDEEATIYFSIPKKEG